MPEVKTNREVELEIMLELAKDTIGIAIDALRLASAEDNLTTISLLLSTKAKIIAKLNGRNGV